MGFIPGAIGQQASVRLYDASGTITAGGTAQLILPKAITRSSLIIENISAVNMIFEIGPARAIATITSGVVTSVTVTNAGMGYSYPPSISFLGGGNTGWDMNNPNYLSAGSPGFPSPASPARARCVMTGSAPNMSIASIVVESGGSGYANAPYVSINNSANDPAGCALPSATSGILLLANGGSYTANGTVCTTDPVSVFCATTSSAFTVKFSL